MSLDERVLERLLIDRALGGSSDEVNALLEAYLGHDSKTQALADEIADTVDLAKKALAEPRELPLPLLPPLLSVPRRVGFLLPNRWKIVRQVTALATCVLLGLGIGTWLVRAAPEPTSPLFTRTYDQPPSRSDSEPSEIWSVERFLQRAARARRSSPTGYVWDLSEWKLKKKEDSI